MLRSSFSTILSGKLSQVLPVQLQTLRWKRKPRKPFWLGTAKSKKFRIYEAPVQPPEEVAELHRLHANYKTAMKSIRHYYENLVLTQSKTESLEFVTQENIDASMKRNEEWNAQGAKIRAERLAKADKDNQEDVINILMRREADDKILQEQVEEIVRLEKERSKTFVTRENLDEKIEECLNSLTDYNYAIDLQGNIYTGYETDMKIKSTRTEVEERKNVAENN